MVRTCCRTLSVGWPSRKCQSSTVVFRDEDWLSLEDKQLIGESRLVGNLYKPCSR